MEKSLHICAMSDLHGNLPKDVPACDVVCICGDIVPLDYQRDDIKSVSWFILDFVPWAESLDCKKVIFVGGNHDFFLHSLARGKNIDAVMLSGADVMRRMLVGVHKGEHDKIVYLMDSGYEYEGVTFYGSPWIADLSNWAFYKTDEDRKAMFSRIPEKVDVLLTHQPPTLNGCGVVLQDGFNYLSDYGDDVLSEAINVRDIKWALSGHVHSGRHICESVNGTNVVNVSLLDERYKRNYGIFEFDIEINIERTI